MRRAYRRRAPVGHGRLGEPAPGTTGPRPGISIYTTVSGSADRCTAV